jgi:hypothetical protein
MCTELPILFADTDLEIRWDSSFCQHLLQYQGTARGRSSGRGDCSARSTAVFKARTKPSVRSADAGRMGAAPYACKTGKGCVRSPMSKSNNKPRLERIMPLCRGKPDALRNLWR